MKKTLVGLVAAAGILGCARDVPVYSPQPETVVESPGVGAVYKSVWSDAEQLKISWFIQMADGRKPSESSLSIYEPANSAECLRENFQTRERFEAPEYGVAGWIDISFEDTGCEGRVDLCKGTYTPDQGSLVDLSSDLCPTANEDMAQVKNFVNDNFYNLQEQLTRWHLQKGVE